MNNSFDKINHENLGQEVHYDEYRWRIFKKKRLRSLEILDSLKELGESIIVIGSVARGDVRENSDIDIFILGSIQSYKLEYILENKGYKIYNKEIIQATPNYAPKAYYYIDSDYKEVISFPLAKLNNNELEFYGWGGKISKNEILLNKRVPGVNKELKLIIPTDFGHIEYPIFGRESEVSRILNIKLETVLERERVLSRRKEIGKTGVFLKYEVPFDEPLDEAIEFLMKKNQFFAKRMMEYNN
ncbi:putative nucleotidyltransferase [Caldisphaera lagunensis DSM 15908]|uniref:Putative nucleotidyltransferase n=1 Tax=Caldisphaera lagunensis (strain DSM 15908 / JCM 11604 / ANMR 0165 / IC-154) TaxID=1056495 RepID=L0AAJ6_CALLD|nr:nucleotidyltransferase domain-containing protein [Caldisphaera lagunensis]AFZ70117.1 putative nucleotidyltransferase [Caldisphaera lagunensis DSM 15908]